MGIDRKTADQRGDFNSFALISGAFGGNTIDFRQFAAMGVVLLGRLVSACGSVLQFAPDLGKNLAFGDTSFAMFLDMVDAHVDAHYLDVPDDSVARQIFPDPSCLTMPINRLDIGAEGVSTIISATGYRYDFGWIEAPVFVGQGKPVHRNGITEVPGLYFLGLQ
jgi:putative flavoprotein involved in K+ transport